MILKVARRSLGSFLFPRLRYRVNELNKCFTIILIVALLKILNSFLIVKDIYDRNLYGNMYRKYI